MEVRVCLEMQVEKRYEFKALYYTPKDFATYEEYAAVHGTDLPDKDIGLYAPSSHQWYILWQTHASCIRLAWLEVSSARSLHPSFP